MMQRNPIIDSLDYLTNLSDDELREVLLEDKYNKANLRELIRQLITANQQLEKAHDYQMKKCNQAEEVLLNMKRRISGMAKDY